MSFYKNDTGYTLIEAILIIALVGILSAVVIPSFGRFLPFLQSNTTVSQIKKELQLIKSRALADPNLHTGLYLDTTSYPHSVQSFFDDNNDNYFTRGEDRLLSQTIPLPETDTLMIPDGYPDIIIFRGNGSAKISARFIVKKKHNVTDTISVLASTGRIKLMKGRQ